jgi:acyl carrier protein
MGLDSVELIMEVEKAFDIRIPDQEAEKATTVGELYETVWRHIKHDHDGRCTSQMLFYLIRRKLIEKIGLNRSDVTIEANPDQLFETGQKRLIYAQISEEMQLEFPPLVLRRPWDNILGWTATGLILSSLALTIYLVNFKDYSGWIFVLNLIPIILLMEISRYFDPLRTRVPHQNMRNFIQDVLKLNYPKIKGVNGITRKEMEQVIDLIIIDKLGVDPSEVSPEKSFTDDLGVD